MIRSSDLLKSQKGFTLIGTMVSTAVGLLVAVAMTDFLVDFVGIQRAGKFKLDSDAVSGEIRMILTSKVACTNTFEGLALSSSANHNIADIKDDQDDDQFSRGEVYGDNNLVLESMNFTDYADARPSDPDDRTGYATLFLSMQKRGDNQGIDQIDRKIKIATMKDEQNRLVSCIALSGTSESMWKYSPANLLDIYYNEGKVGIGVDHPSAKLHVGGAAEASILVTNTQNVGAGGTGAGFVNFAGNYDGNYPFLHMQSARGTIIAPAALRAGDRLGSLGFAGYTGAGKTSANAWGIGGNAPAAINFTAEQNFTASSTPTYMTIHTTGPSSPAAEVQAERLRITGGGWVGIGTQRPMGKLHVHKKGDQGEFIISGVADLSRTFASLSLSNNALDPKTSSWVLAHKDHAGLATQNSFHLARWGAGIGANPPLAILTNRFVGINTELPQKLFHVAGETIIRGDTKVEGHLKIIRNLNATTVMARSDRGLKRSIERVPKEALENLKKLATYSYLWKWQKQSSQRQIGVLAQEVEEIFPELVRSNEDGIRSVDYNGLAALSISAVNQLAQHSMLAKQKAQSCKSTISELNAKALEAEAEVLKLKQKLRSLQKLIRTHAEAG